MGHPRIHPCSEEELVYDAISKRQPVHLNLLIEVTGLQRLRLKDRLRRLRLAGLIRAAACNESSWSIGRCTRLDGNEIRGRLGATSAVRRVFEAGGEHTAEEIAARIGTTTKIVASQLTKLVAANAIVRTGAVYKRRSVAAVVHLFGLVPGGGERRDCANYEWCLDQLSYKYTGDAHCPKDCRGFKLPDRTARFAAAMVQRRSIWDGVQSCLV